MTYLFIRYMIISLIVIAIVLAISLVFALCRKRISSIVMVGIIAGAEAFAYQNISMQGRLRIFKKINIINVMNVSSILRKYDNIMIAGVPVRMINVLCMVCISIAVISAIFLALLGKVIRPGRTAGFIGKMIEKNRTWSSKGFGQISAFLERNVQIFNNSKRLDCNMCCCVYNNIYM